MHFHIQQVLPKAKDSVPICWEADQSFAFFCSFRLRDTAYSVELRVRTAGTC